MVVIRNAFYKTFVFHIVKKFWPTSKTSKSRLGNKSAFLCAVLIYFANKNDQYLIKMTYCCDLSTHPPLKLSPISADNSWDKKQPNLYALAYIDSSSLRLCHFVLISYHGDIESRMLQIRIIRSDTRNVRYDRSYT